MKDVLDALVMAQYGITALSSGFNAWYFLNYRTPEGRRRVGAAVMTVVSLALAVESLYFGWVLFPQGSDSGHWLMAGALALGGSLLISLLILRRLLRGKG